MNWLAIGGFGAVTAGLLYVFVDQKPADVYDMPVAQAYSLLENVQYEQPGEGEAGAGIRHSSTGNGTDKVTWVTSGSHVHRTCDMALAPFEGDAGRTHVTVTCGGRGAGEGAAGGIAHNMHRNRIIERVDATLTGRPYDRERVGATASRWPGDGVDGSLSTAMGNALKMDQEMRTMQADAEEFRREELERAEEAASDRYYAGQESAYDGERTYEESDY